MADIKIVISALNKASGDLKKVKGDIQGLGTSGKEAKGGLAGLSDGLKTAGAIAAGVTAAIGATAGAIKLLTDAAQEGAAFQRIEEASGSLAASMGADMDEILSALRGASLGMVSDFDLMQAASRAMMLGVSADAGQLSQLMEVAAIRGRAMGLSTTQAFNDIVTGIGRASPLILDNLGIVVDAEANYQAYADSIGKTSEELSKAEKTQALLNGVLESSKGLLESTGGLTVDNAGKWEQLHAAQKNYFDMLKSDLADGMSWWAEYWATVFNDRADVKKGREIWEQARDMMLITSDMQAAYDAAVRGGQSDYNFILQNADMITTLEQRIKLANASSEAWAANNKSVTDSLEGNTDALGKGSAAWQSYQDIMADPTAYGTSEEYQQRAIKLTEEQAKEMERMLKLRTELMTVTSLDKNFTGMIGYAKKYDDVLEQINEETAKMAVLDIDSEEFLEAKDKVDELNQSLRDMANQVVLDMFQATIAVGGVTKAESEAYFNMAVGMELISRDAANAAIKAYGDAVDTINEYEINEKTGNVKFEIDTSEPDNYKPVDKKAKVSMKLDSSEIDGWNPPTKYGTVNYLPAKGQNNAVGGAVYAGNPYTWQEYGYRGELFIPSQDGYILSRADAERALSRALVEGKSGGGEIDYERLAGVLSRVVNGNSKSQKGGNTYNLNVQGGGSPSRDVAATFDLLRAYGGNF